MGWRAISVAAHLSVGNTKADYLHDQAFGFNSFDIN